MERAIEKPLDHLFSSGLFPATRTRSLSRHRALAWLLAVTGIVSAALLLVALQAGSRSTHAFQDVNLSGSLRYRSLWVYGATQESGTRLPEDSRWQAQVEAMRGIRERLRPRYPAAVGATDPAWGDFTGSLGRTGRVDWRTGNEMRLAADAMTHRIQEQASAQNASASLLLRAGLAGLLCALTAAGLLLGGLGTTEADIRRALAGLQDGRDLFHRSINSVQEGFVVQDCGGTILLCNEEAERLLGNLSAVLIGQSGERQQGQLLCPSGEVFAASQHPVRQALETGLPQEAVVLGIRRPGREVLWLSLKAAPVFHMGQPMPYAAVLTFADVSAKKLVEDEKKKIEKELQAEREFQQAMLASLQSGIVACDADGTLTLFNQAAREFYGLLEMPLPPEAQTHHFDLYRADGITPLLTSEIPLFRALRGEVVRDTEIVIAPVGGQHRTVNASGQAIYSRDGKKIGAVVAIHDITARRHIERELARLAAIVESSEEAILAATLDGTVVSWNAGAERLYGYKESEVIGQHASVLVPAGEASPVDAVLPRLLRGEQIEPVEVVRHRRDGAVLNVSLNFSPIHDAQGQIIGFSCIARDVTAQHQAELALRESEGRLRYLSDAAFEGTAVSQNGVIIDVNRAFLQLYGYETREELIGMVSTDLAAPGSRELVQRKVTGREEDAYEAWCLRRDGSTFQAEVRGRSVLWNGQPARVTAVHDVTERKALEEGLRAGHQAVQESEARLAEAQRIAQIGSWEYDLVSGKVTWSNELFRLFGLDPAAGEPDYAAAVALYDPEDAPKLDALITRAAQEGIGYALDLRGARSPLDGSQRWYHTAGNPITDGAGRVIRLVGILADITERKAMEEELRAGHQAVQESEARLAEAQRIAQIGSWEYDLVSGKVTWSNELFRLFGLDPAAGEPDYAAAVALYDPEDAPKLDALITRAAQEGTDFALDLRGAPNPRGGGPQRWYHAAGSAVRDGSGQVIRLVGILADITERKAMEEELRAGHQAVQESEARLAKAQRIAKVGSWEYDPFSGETVWSGQMFRLLGRDPEAGVPGFEDAMAHYHPDDSPRLKSLVARAAKEGLGYELDLRGNPLFFPDGPTRWYHTTGEVTTDASGRVTRLTGTLADVTERRAMEDALRHSEEALRAMLGSAPVILYATDAEGIVTLSEGTGLTALGLAPGEAVGRSVFEFSGGDPLMDENTRRALSGEVISCDTHVGALCLHVELRPQRDPGGKITGLIGVCFDITERAQSEERFRVLFEQSSDAHLLFDETGIMDCNHAAITMLNCSDKSEVLALHPAALSPEFQPDGQRSDVKCIAMDAAAYADGYHRFEWLHRKMDGEEFPVEVTLTPVALQGKPVLLVVWHDLTRRKQAEQQIKDYMVVLEFQKSQLEETNQELEALATTDGLTGLKNHRTFQQKLAEEHTRAVRYHQPLSLLLLDVDHFKQYNDSFGHPAGDAVLKQVAWILGTTARDTDIVARYGGEEFTVILPQTDEAGALAIAERVRHAIAEAVWDQRPITISLGVSTLSLDTPTSGSLVACSDKALYQSKTLGRNCVSHGNPSAPPVTRPARAKRPRPVPQDADKSLAE